MKFLVALSYFLIAVVLALLVYVYVTVLGRMEPIVSIICMLGLAVCLALTHLAGKKNKVPLDTP